MLAESVPSCSHTETQVDILLESSYLLQLTVNVLNNQIQRYKVLSTWRQTAGKDTKDERPPPTVIYGDRSCVSLSSQQTSGYHDVSDLHRGFDVLLKRRLYKLVVLFDDAADVPSTL